MITNRRRFIHEFKGVSPNESVASQRANIRDTVSTSEGREVVCRKYLDAGKYQGVVVARRTLEQNGIDLNDSTNETIAGFSGGFVGSGTGYVGGNELGTWIGENAIDDTPDVSTLSRRRFMGGLALSAVGVGVGAPSGVLVGVEAIKSNVERWSELIGLIEREMQFWLNYLVTGEDGYYERIIEYHIRNVPLGLDREASSGVSGLERAAFHFTYSKIMNELNNFDR